MRPRPGHPKCAAPASCSAASAARVGATQSSPTIPRPVSDRHPRVASMPLHVHRADRTDLLADRLGALLSRPLEDPFAMELVLVPARGTERWLSQRLSHVLGRGAAADGVCAGVEFRNPQSLIAEITGTADDDPWTPDVMVWPLLEVIDENLDEPWCRTLATHLGHFADGDEKELRQGRRYAVARRLAGLFASYDRQR